jgi:hypothetical protein
MDILRGRTREAEGQEEQDGDDFSVWGGGGGANVNEGVEQALYSTELYSYALFFSSFYNSALMHLT